MSATPASGPGLEPQFIAACWTSAGDVMPARGPDTSPLDVATRIRAVAAAGYTGFGLAHQDLVVARDTIGLPAVARLLAEHGITYVQLERIVDWWATGEARERSDRVRADLFAACPVLGVDSIKIGAEDVANPDGSPVSWDQFCTGFGELATEAEELGVVIGYENTPFSPEPIRRTEQAVRLVTDVAHPNGGVVLDVWHAYRGGTRYADLPGLLPREHLVGVELDDGRREVVGTQLEDTFDNRMVCGTGDFDVPAFVEAVRAIGWDGPWGLEHMSVEYRALPVEQALRQVREAALTVL